MLTPDQLQVLRLNWSLVIQAYMEAEYSTRLNTVPKGDPDNLTTLLSTWDTAIPNTYPAPTEAQIITALGVVETSESASATLRAEIKGIIQTAVGKRYDELTNIELRALLAITIFNQHGLDNDGIVQPLHTWLDK